MAKFLTGKALTEKIYDIIWKAEDELIIVSPYIKLDDYFKQLFLNHKNNYKLHITILFGKNEASPSKSLRMEDFEFFTQFRNISIVYCKDLHAKYYANDKEGVLTSINLYDSSFETNIEYGVGYKRDLMDKFTTSYDAEAWNFTLDTVSTSPAIFIKRPVFAKGFMGIGKNYIDSEILLDQTESFWKGRKWNLEEKHYVLEYPGEISSSSKKTERPEKPEKPSVQIDIRDYSSNQYVKKSGKYNESFSRDIGYCIRTGVQIPFNPSKPFCDDAYQSWAQWKNADYEENYCHRTGRKSYGKTSKRNPIL